MVVRMPRRRLLEDRSRLLAFLAGALTVALVWTVTWRRRLAAEPRPRLAAPSLAEVMNTGESTAIRAPVRPPPLPDRHAAARAWRYFETHTDLLTGLAPVLASTGATTPWTIGAQAAAILSAEDLGLVDATGSRRRLHQLIDSVAAMATSPDGRLGRRYDARCLTPLDEEGRRTNEVVAAGPEEIARLAGPLAVAVARHPALAAQGRPLLERLARGARGRGAAVVRPGFDRYVVRALALAGVALPPTTMAGAFVEGVVVPCVVDADDHCVASSDAVLLEALEFGVDPASEIALRAVFEAHRRLARRTGRLLAPAGEDLRRRPWHRSVLVVEDGVAWAHWPRGTPEGDRLLTTKGAFGWSALLDDPVAQAMRLDLDGIGGMESGWSLGRSEERWRGEPSADTNALVLEAVAYTARGPLSPVRSR
jgi:hypothetical protein